MTIIYKSFMIFIPILKRIRNIYVVLKNKYVWWELTSPTYRYILVLKGAYLKKLVRKVFTPVFVHEMRKEDNARFRLVNLTKELTDEINVLKSIERKRNETYYVQPTETSTTGFASVL